MLDSHGFNLWAEDYDTSVHAADDNNGYPFAGYKKLMNVIYGTVMSKCPAKVLDIGIGTGTLAYKLYVHGNDITGVDFSKEMLHIAQDKMPDARLVQCNFSEGLPPVLNNSAYDFIISTYALHHLTDAEKIPFIASLMDLLNEDGSIIIGDVSFQTRCDLEKCQNMNKDIWDSDEYYFVYEEIHEKLKNVCEMTYQQFSHCSGIIEIRRMLKK